MINSSECSLPSRQSISPLAEIGFSTSCEIVARSLSSPCPTRLRACAAAHGITSNASLNECCISTTKQSFPSGSGSGTKWVKSRWTRKGQGNNSALLETQHNVSRVAFFFRTCVCFPVAAVLFLLLAHTAWSCISHSRAPSPSHSSLSRIHSLEVKSEIPLQCGTGFYRLPADSTVFMMHDRRRVDSHEKENTGNGHELDYHGFGEVAAAFLATPHDAKSTVFYDFIRRRDATLWTVQEESGVGLVARPFQLDVVYTYVNPAAPSFSGHMRERGLSTGINKLFRDWEELRFSMRSLYHHVVNNSALEQLDRNLAEDQRRLTQMGFIVKREEIKGGEEGVREAQTLPLVRSVIVVVSDPDQVPAWLNTSYPGVLIVTHEVLYTAEEKEAHALPTFNSLSIESTLYRIPGLTRFYVNINNDMLFSRKVSLFDLFRPLAPPRQTMHFASIMNSTVVDVLKQRALTFMEPILHSDGWVRPSTVVEDALAEEKTRKRAKQKKRENDSMEGAAVPLTQLQQRQRKEVWQCEVDFSEFRDAFTSVTLKNCSAPSPCSLAAFLAPPLACPNALNKEARYVTLRSLQGVAPTIEYAHIPHIVDRMVMKKMLEDEVDGFAEEAIAVRLSYQREHNNFSPIHVYTPYALAMRRAVDRYQRYTTWRQFWTVRQSAAGAMTTPLHDETFLPEDSEVPWRLSCPLCGDSSGVHQQHPELDHLLLSRQHLIDRSSQGEGWQEDGKTAVDRIFDPTEEEDDEAKRARARSVRHSGKDRTTFIQRETALLDLARRASQWHILSGNSDEKATTTTDSVLFSVARAERYLALYTDVHHHIRDLTLWFIMIEDYLRLAIAANAAAKKAQAQQLPLFITINDDIRNDVLRNNEEKFLLLFQAVFAKCTGGVPAAPWEIAR